MDIEAEINQMRGVLDVQSRISRRIRVLQMQRAQLDAAIAELQMILTPPVQPSDLPLPHRPLMDDEMTNEQASPGEQTNEQAE